MDSLQSIVCSVGCFFIPLKTAFKSPYSEEVPTVTGAQKEKIIRFRSMGRGYADIGKELGIPKDTVKSFCRRNSLTSADILVTDDKDRCRECGVEIKQRPKMKKQVFCCKACREKWWTEHPERITQKAVYEFTCAKCGKPFTAYGNKKRKYCSHECYIADRFGGGGNG